MNPINEFHANQMKVISESLQPKKVCPTCEQEVNAFEEFVAENGIHVVPVVDDGERDYDLEIKDAETMKD